MESRVDAGGDGSALDRAVRGPGPARRRRMANLLATARLDGAQLLHRLRELRSLEGVAACSSALHVLTHIDLGEPEADALLCELLRHRDAVAGRLGRDPGLVVAAADFLTNIRPLLRCPAVVEFSQLEETERYAISDPLTDLFNRRFFHSALRKEIRRCRRNGMELSLLLLDLDKFKSVNDVYGHPFGDQVLRRAGQLVRRSVRESDIACRYGGEEFAVILPETGRLGAHTSAERVRQRVAEGIAERPIGGRIVALTISGGIASLPEDGESADRLAKLADRALYRAKAAGRNRVELHHAERRRAVRHPVGVATQASVGRIGEHDVNPVRVIDLSACGARIESPGRLFAIADAVELTLARGGRMDSIAARVVRVERHAAAEHDCRLALAFQSPLSAQRVRDHSAGAHARAVRARTT